MNLSENLRAETAVYLTQTYKKSPIEKCIRGVIMKLIKKGTLTKSEANELLIVAENNKVYKVDPTVVAIWNKCDGNRTQEQIVDELADETKLEKSKISGVVSDIVAKLEQASLVQKV